MNQMPKAQPVNPETEYRAIEAALLESARGRWFLAEHSRRARRIDTFTLHDAISRLQSSLREPPALLGQLQHEIEGLQGLLRETRAALVQKPVDPAGTAPGTASGPNGIIAAAEGIHELAWSLHAREIDVETCEKIARQASSIYALSVRHAAESDRIKRLTQALDGALGRLDGLLETIGHEGQLDSFTMPPAEDEEHSGAPALLSAQPGNHEDEASTP
ncbi:MAG: hypothetical protein KDJ36_11370 [Hyphomicrobiaceae bacterium]|nr:hypothetical protein [Hyphomicrobiaceae bacterium]